MKLNLTIAEFHQTIYTHRKIATVAQLLKCGKYMVERSCLELCEKYKTDDFSYDALRTTKPEVYQNKYPQIINDFIINKQMRRLHESPLSDIHGILYGAFERHHKLTLTDASVLLRTNSASLNQFLFDCTDQVSLENKHDFSFDVFKTTSPEIMQLKYPALYHSHILHHKRKLDVLPFNYIHQIILECKNKSIVRLETHLQVRFRQLQHYLNNFNFDIAELRTLTSEQMNKIFAEQYSQPWPISKAPEIILKKQHYIEQRSMLADTSKTITPLTQPMTMPVVMNPTITAPLQEVSPIKYNILMNMKPFNMPSMLPMPQMSMPQMPMPQMPMPQMLMPKMPMPQMFMPPVFPYSNDPFSLYSKQPMFQPPMQNPFLAAPSFQFSFYSPMPQMPVYAPTPPSPIWLYPVTSQTNAAQPTHPKTSTMRPQKTSKAHDHFVTSEQDRTEKNRTEKEAAFAKRAKTIRDLPFFSKKQSTKPNRYQFYGEIKEIEETETTETDTAQFDF